MLLYCHILAASFFLLPVAAADDQAPEIRWAQVGRKHAGNIGGSSSAVSYTWGAVSPGTGLTSYYFPSNRDPDQTHTIDWYKANHPDWVVYKCDRVTPAFDHVYAHGALTPVDISNPEVRSYITKTFLQPALAKGFQSIGLDNVALTNGPQKCGVWRNGKWEQLYRGTTHDPAYSYSIINYMGYLRDSIHALGGRIAINAKIDKSSPQQTLALVNLADIWLDESGFSNDCRHKIVDGVWDLKRHLLEDSANARMHVSVNYICKDGPDSDKKKELTWILANYFLFKSPKSYLSIITLDDHTRAYLGNWTMPRLGPAMDPRPVFRDGLFLRRFGSGLVVVNPSSTHPVEYASPGHQYKIWPENTPFTAATIPPRSGLVLEATR